MKTLKKTLCVVLAVVMVVGTLALTAGATDYVDDADITYDEAVEVLSSGLWGYTAQDSAGIVREFLQ